jgi:hypothetical protein
VNNTLRTFIRVLGTGVITIPLGVLTSQIVMAADIPKLDPEGSAAKALAYVHESADGDRSCLKCQFYTKGSEVNWGNCVIFPEKLVSARGLCNSWYAKA